MTDTGTVDPLLSTHATEMCEIIEIIGTAGFDEAGPRPHDTEAGETFIVGVVDPPSLRLTIPAPDILRMLDVLRDVACQISRCPRRCGGADTNLPLRAGRMQSRLEGRAPLHVTR